MIMARGKARTTEERISIISAALLKAKNTNYHDIKIFPYTI